MRGFTERFWAPFSMVVIFILIVVLATVIVTDANNARKNENGGNFFTPAKFEAKPSSTPLLSANNNVYWVADLVEKALPFVVHIRTERTGKHPTIFKEFKPKDEDMKKFFEDFFPFGFEFRFPDIEEREIPISGVGSGFLISKDGYILTNTHVIEGADKIIVKTSDGKEYNAKLVGTDTMKDVAVLKIDAKGLPYAKLGDSSKLRIGEPAIAIGSPFGLEATVTAGIVSSVGRNASELRTPADAVSGLGARIRKLIQTDAAINQGNSGGPLLNAKGEVIGVNQAIIPYASRIGFAIPINEVKSSIDQIIKKGKVVYPGIGVLVQDVTKENREELKVEVEEGAYIWQVVNGGAADRAGLAPGDVILQIENKPIKNADELVDEIQRYKVGEKVTLLVAKGGKKDKKVKVGVILKELEREKSQE